MPTPAELMEELGFALGVYSSRVRVVEPEEFPLRRPQCLPSCGTAYRGCDPKCFGRLYDELEDARDKLQEARTIYLQLRDAQ